MGLDLHTCARARLARDARFDGKFFIAVLTTGIYCRPICPARTCKECNVRYYETAAAASEAGFRPCLRCRPELSPGTPARLGTQNTVSRALRLIHDGGLEDGGVEGLAEKLGVGSRHLRRLFLQHLGATPSAVAQTTRLHFAKRLIDETALPMTEIAIASGFGSVRRFNAAIRKTYDRTPTQIRSLVKQTPSQPDDQYLFRLDYRPPFNWDGMLSFLAARATPGVEIVANGSYRRSISLNGKHGFFEASLTDDDAVAVRVQFADPRALFLITERVRAMLDLNADWAEIARNLNFDPMLRRVIADNPGLRVPGCWDQFELVVRAILGQQITVGNATRLAGLLAKTFGAPIDSGCGLTHLFPSAASLADADVAQIGLPRARANTIRAFARAVCDGRVCFSGNIESEALLAQLCEVPGIGRWTAQYVAMRALREPDAFPLGDVALLRSLGLRSERELESRAEMWRPWRAYAAMYLWSIAGKKSIQTPKTRDRSKKPALDQITHAIYMAAGD